MGDQKKQVCDEHIARGGLIDDVWKRGDEFTKWSKDKYSGLSPEVIASYGTIGQHGRVSKEILDLAKDIHDNIDDEGYRKILQQMDGTLQDQDAAVRGNAQ